MILILQSQQQGVNAAPVRGTGKICRKKHLTILKKTLNYKMAGGPYGPAS
jgi:hypothetical protein